MTPGVNRRNKKKSSTSGLNTLSVRDTKLQFEHSRIQRDFQKWKQQNYVFGHLLSHSKMKGCFKKGSALPRRTHSCCVILQWQNIKILYRYHSISPQVPISTAAFNSSCTKVIFPEPPSEASKWPSSNQGSLRWYFNFTSTKSPRWKKLPRKKRTIFKKKPMKSPLGRIWDVLFFFSPPPTKKNGTGRILEWFGNEYPKWLWRICPKQKLTRSV